MAKMAKVAGRKVLANNYEYKKQRLIEQMRSREGSDVRLHKTTSNLFRDRDQTSQHKLDVSDFNQVLRVDESVGLAEIEGMAPYASIVDATLPHGVMPAVVPQLKSITLGGATTGCGIESSSCKYGLVHETVTEMEVLLADGRVVVCSPSNEHSDLFFAFPNSYGTLGYALKLRLKVFPVKDFVQLTHVRYSDAKTYFNDMKDMCTNSVDFLDGVVFGPDEMYMTVGKFVDEAPYTSDYTYENIYYKSIRRRQTDYLTVLDYLWRWDTDWFWCSKNFLVQHTLVRALVGKSRLNSVTYTKIMRWNNRWKLAHRINRLRGIHTESIIQDVDVAIDNAPAFLEFFNNEIGITPIWICPIQTYDRSVQFDLYQMNPQQVYVNFGFWDVKRGRKKLPKGHYNRQIERKIIELGGIKSLYSDSYFTPEEFWQAYNQRAYDKLKAKYDPQARLKNIYQKCVLKQ